MLLTTDFFTEKQTVELALITIMFYFLTNLESTKMSEKCRSWVIIYCKLKTLHNNSYNINRPNVSLFKSNRFSVLLFFTSITEINKGVKVKIIFNRIS